MKHQRRSVRCPSRARTPNPKIPQATTRGKRSECVPRCSGVPEPGRNGVNRTAGPKEARSAPLGWRPPRAAGLRAGAHSSAAPSSQHRTRGPVRWDASGARLAWTIFPVGKPLGPLSARSRQPSGLSASSARGLPRRARAAHILKDRQPHLSRIDSNFLKRESADSMNQALPGGRGGGRGAEAPARNILFVKQFIPSLRAFKQITSPGPQARTRPEERSWERCFSPDLHSRPLSPAPRPRGARGDSGGSSPGALHPWQASPQGSLCPGGCSHGRARRTRRPWSRARGGVGGDKCQRRGRERNYTDSRPQPGPGTHRSGLLRPPRSEAAPQAARARGPSALAAAAPLPRLPNAAERAAALPAGRFLTV